jgi:hypothetical protein
MIAYYLNMAVGICARAWARYLAKPCHGSIVPRYAARSMKLPRW